jgi:hypothetical protein
MTIALESRTFARFDASGFEKARAELEAMSEIVTAARIDFIFDLHWWFVVRT